MNNAHGLIVDTHTTQANGRAERESASEILEARPGKGRLTVDAGKGYEYKHLVEGLRWAKVRPHAAQNDANRRSAIDRHNTRHIAYAQSQPVRKRIEAAFGVAKPIGSLCKLKHRPLPRVTFQFNLTFFAYNLGRLRTLCVGTSPPFAYGRGPALPSLVWKGPRTGSIPSRLRLSSHPLAHRPRRQYSRAWVCRRPVAGPPAGDIYQRGFPPGNTRRSIARPLPSRRKPVRATCPNSMIVARSSTALPQFSTGIFASPAASTPSTVSFVT